MDTGRIEYVLRLELLDDSALGAAARAALLLVGAEVASAETDIPWASRDGWPADVVAAASRLCDRFVQAGDRDEHYMQTGVQSVADGQVLDDFMTVAPFAFDATFWRADGAEVASLADEGTSFVIWLSDEQRAGLVDVVGAAQIIPLSDWRRAQPTMWRTLLNRLKPTGR